MRNFILQRAVQEALQYIGEQWAYGRWMADYRAKQRRDSANSAQGA